MAMTQGYPAYAFGWKALGAISQRLSNFARAAGCLKRAAELEPQDAEAHSNLGAALRELGMLAEAEQRCRQALQLQPGLAQAHVNLVNVLVDAGRLDEALTACQQTLAVAPNWALAHNNHARVLMALGRPTAACASSQRAIDLKPDFPEAHNNLGSVLADLGQMDTALAAFQQALKLQPDYSQAADNLLFTVNYHPDLSGQQIYAAYKAYDTQFGKPKHLVDKQALYGGGNGRRRLRVGYLSPDFRAHPCRFFLEPLISCHDRAFVEVSAYSQTVREDSVTQRYKASVDHWVSTTGLSDDALAQRIRHDCIDILVDLAGHTRGNRLGVMARKPAPVSVSWLGFGYTTGLRAVDYFLCDEHLVPPGNEELFSERPWLLEGPSLVYRPAEGMGETGLLPALTNGFVTFGTLTRSVRINHHTLRAWSEILKRVPSARLVVNSGDYRDESLREALLQQFEAHGVARTRLFVGFNSPPWDTLRSIDITLDCFPHNSGTTLFESLYMGAPFITMAGRPSVGRLGSAILHGLGEERWIARTHDEYVQKAVALASDLPELAEVRAALRQKMLAGPLMDELGFARRVEGAYQQMWEKSRLQ